MADGYVYFVNSNFVNSKQFREMDMSGMHRKRNLEMENVIDVNETKVGDVFEVVTGVCKGNIYKRIKEGRVIDSLETIHSINMPWSNGTKTWFDGEASVKVLNSSSNAGLDWNPMPELESGMTVETKDGYQWLLLTSKKQLVGVRVGRSNLAFWRPFLENGIPHKDSEGTIIKIWEAQNFGVSSYPASPEDKMFTPKPIWERKAEPVGFNWKFTNDVTVKVDPDGTVHPSVGEDWSQEKVEKLLSIVSKEVDINDFTIKKETIKIGCKVFDVASLEEFGRAYKKLLTN